MFIKKNSRNELKFCYLYLATVSFLIPILSLPHTMAGRNILMVLGVLFLILAGLNWGAYKGKLILFILFVLYLPYHAFFLSSEVINALKNFRSEWLKFIVFYVLGLGFALIVIRCNIYKSLLWLGLLFSLPNFVHLTLSLNKFILAPYKFPIGYLGINTMHGELAYSGLAGIIPLLTFLFFKQSKIFDKFIAVLSVIVIISSLLVAKSRGGILFSVLSFSLIFAIYLYFRLIRINSINYFQVTSYIFSLFILIFCIFSIAQKSDPENWSGIFGRLAMGAKADSLMIACKGVDVLEEEYKQEKGYGKIQHQIESVKDGDGARMLMAISGFWLMLEYPNGIDQSRQAYKIALERHCNGEASVKFSHSHNGWINTALSIGIFGLSILLLIFFTNMKFGLKNFYNNRQLNPYAICLFSFSVVWFFRGLLDATMQDQMLEIQAFSIASYFGLVSIKKENSKNLI